MSELNNQFFRKIENLYEIGLSNLKFESLSNVELKYISWLLLLEQRNFTDFFKTGEELTAKSNLIDEKVFFLSWLIIGTEVQYNLQLRQNYLLQLQNLSSTKFNLHLEFAKLYFQSLTYFYDSDLLISESILNKAITLAENLNYTRGLARCYYQKALISKEMSKPVEFNHYIKKCIEICSVNTFIKTKNKAFLLFMNSKSLNTVNECQIENKIQNINQALIKKDLKYARLLISEAETLRRKKLYSRQKFSIYKFRIQYLLANYQITYARRLMLKLKDQVIKYELYLFMINNNINLLEYEENNLKVIELALDVKSQQSTAAEKVISMHKVSIMKVKNQYVQKLLKTLSEHTALDKESLFESIYEISYDPVIHDSKIYKLILKAKKDLTSDIIINSYGKYSLNFDRYQFIS